MIKKMKVITAVLLVSLLFINVFTVHAAQDEGYVCARDEIAQWIIATAAILNYENNGDYRLFGKSQYELENFIRVQYPIDIYDIFQFFDFAISTNICLLDFNDEVRTLINNERDNLINYGLSFNKDLIYKSTFILYEWNIHNDNDLRNQINRLLDGSHNERFIYTYNEIRNLINEYSDDILSYIRHIGISEYNHVNLIIELSEYWGDRNIIGWDLFRIGTLVSWGYAAGFIEREEAYELMVPAINLLKENFSSWDEAANNYIDGFLWWLGPEGQRPFVNNYKRYSERIRIFNNLREANPYLFDDALFSNPHITNDFQRPVNP